MTVDPLVSTDLENRSATNTRAASRKTAQGLTREQFEAAMRVMDARSPTRPMAGSPDTVSPAAP